MRYDSHINNIDPIIKAYEYYISHNESQKNVCEKFNINFHAFTRYSKQFKGGGFNRNLKVELKNVPVQNIKNGEIQKNKANKLMDDMKNIRGGSKQKMDDFVDDINKLKNKNQPKETDIFKKASEKNSDAIKNKEVFHIPPSKPHIPVNV